MIGSDHSFDIHRGDDRVLKYQLVNQDTPGIAVDISGALIEWVLVEQDAATTEPQPKNGAVALVSKSTPASGVVITNASEGRFEVTLASADTVTRKAPDIFYHEIQVSLGGLVTTVIFGNITMKRENIAPGP